MKKVLITGGAGFIGSNLALKLIARNHEVVVLDNLSKQIHGDKPASTSPLYQSIKDKVRFIHGDVQQQSDWLAALEGVDTVVHLAAETGTGQSMYEISRYTDVNVGGTALLLNILANEKHSIRKVIIASSRAIYGEGKYYSEKYGVVFPGGRAAEDMSRGDFAVKYRDDNLLTLMPTDEESKIHPTSVYGITKQNQEQMVMCVCKSIGIAGVAFRYQNVYGAGQSLQNPYTGILSIFSNLIKNNKAINIFEDGLESRDFVYIDDVTDATLLGIESDAANNEVFNVGAGVATDVLTVAGTLCSKYGVDVPVHVTGNFRIGDIRHNYADISKLKTLLGYTPRINFETGIGLFTNWVNEQQVTESRYDVSMAEMKQKGLLK